MTVVAPIATPPAAPPAEMPQLYASVPAAKMAVVKLDRHYRPSGAYEIVGYDKPAVEAKNPAGKTIVLEPAAFVKDEPAPAPMAGVGSASLKLWAGTHVRLPVEEAKAVRKAGIGTIEIDD